MLLFPSSSKENSEPKSNEKGLSTRFVINSSLFANNDFHQTKELMLTCNLKLHIKTFNCSLMMIIITFMIKIIQHFFI